MKELAEFNYDGHQISFEFADENKMINATQMAKSFSKPVGDFLRLKESKEYISILEERYADMNITQKFKTRYGDSHIAHYREDILKEIIK